MKLNTLLEKYEQVIETAFKINYKKKLKQLHDKYITDGVSNEEALRKAKLEFKKKYNIELDEYYPNMGDADIPDGPL